MECLKPSTSSRVSSFPADVSRRDMIRLDKPCGDTLSVLTYNVLADMYSLWNSYFSKIEWESRKLTLVAEIVRYNSDLICLQEVQSNHLHNFWVPQLAVYGYHHIHRVKKNLRLPCIQGHVSDGCAIFYKPKKMNLVQLYKVTFAKLGRSITEKLGNRCPRDKRKLFQDNLAIAGVFELNGSKNRVCVATCHIHANPTNSDVKLLQVTELIRGLKRLNNIGLPIILCGDFNTVPYEQSYKFLVNGHTHVLPRHRDPLSVSPLLDLHHNLELSSAYSALFTSTTAGAIAERRRMDHATWEPKFTTKVPAHSSGGSPSFCGTLDYIFYQKRHMIVTAVLELVDLGEEEYLPSEIFASDHIGLMAEFSLLPLCSSRCLDLPDFIWGLQADVEGP